MTGFLSPTSIVLGALASATFIGCESNQATLPPASAPTATDEVGDKPSKIELALAKLSEVDHKLAVTQAVCPVSGEPLGSMGTPIKVSVDDRQLFICCAGCEEDAKAKFDEYFAQLNGPAEAVKAE